MVTVGMLVCGVVALVAIIAVSATRVSSRPQPQGARIATLSVPADYVPPTADSRDTVDQVHVDTPPATKLTKQQIEMRVRAATAYKVTPVAGGWTPQIGADIANRALKWLNTPYSWDAGNANGPTLGRAVDHDSRNDAHIVGFDCSGLVLYALAPWIHVDHSAAAQYVQAGAMHPTFSQLQPGDLLFWSENGTVNGVGHVAIYIGNGNVVQAPHSGDVVRVTPLNQVEAGTIGTTRPLTA